MMVKKSDDHIDSIISVGYDDDKINEHNYGFEDVDDDNDDDDDGDGNYDNNNVSLSIKLLSTTPLQLL